MNGNKKSISSEKELLKLATDYVLPEYQIKDATIEQIKIKNTEKHRAVYKVSNATESYCLKKIYFDEKKLLFMYSAMQWLHKYGFNVPILMKTKTGSRFVKTNNFIFILTPWVPGGKCDFDNLEHLTLAAKNLALVHKATVNFIPIKGCHEKKGYDNLYISISKHFNKLLACYNLANKKKDRFSKIFLEHFDDNIELAKFALEISSSIDFDNLSKSLCHGDYVNKNLLVDIDNIYMIDFDKCSYDYSMSDLSYFLRRLLKRSDTNWDFKIAKNIIMSYNSKKALTVDDLKYLMVYLSFPQKYWRTSRDYFASISKCNKKSSRDSLLSTVAKTPNQRLMVEQFKVFFSEEFNIIF
ncbi:CotS family spore coat protein [uncultured Clostridium sp.]|jgi:CotS family spore coat protein|uniref:CotS family spore coat protein n=1 Tax=uncultured Clostridium sp. TaxID=59620 RepID=UPI0026127CBC|nr:CotS family spore coat protein [uncultured Clostridium sp.]